MSVARLGVVAYLNARPLVHGLERCTDRFVLRFDPPSVCATALRDGEIDLGTIPSIEYPRGSDYRLVPGVAIASHGPVASVALYSRKPIAAIRSIAADTNSRTSVALLRVLCARAFGIDPALEPMAPDAEAMLARCDAALIIGDAALFLDHEAAGLHKTDLGEVWTALTGRPFVWAVWAGRAGALAPDGIETLQAARNSGVRDRDAIATAYAGGDARRAEIGRRYLRTNMRYDLDEDATAGLAAFFRLAAGMGLAPEAGPLRFY
jgi:chorismate dehydratase